MSSEMEKIMKTKEKLKLFDDDDEVDNDKNLVSING